MLFNLMGLCGKFWPVSRGSLGSEQTEKGYWGQPAFPEMAVKMQCVASILQKAVCFGCDRRRWCKRSVTVPKIPASDVNDDRHRPLLDWPRPPFRCPQWCRPRWHLPHVSTRRQHTLVSRARLDCDTLGSWILSGHRTCDYST